MVGQLLLQLSALSPPLRWRQLVGGRLDQLGKLEQEGDGRGRENGKDKGIKGRKEVIKGIRRRGNWWAEVGWKKAGLPGHSDRSVCGERGRQPPGTSLCPPYWRELHCTSTSSPVARPGPGLGHSHLSPPHTTDIAACRKLWAQQD